MSNNERIRLGNWGNLVGVGVRDSSAIEAERKALGTAPGQEKKGIEDAIQGALQQFEQTASASATGWNYTSEITLEGNWAIYFIEFENVYGSTWERGNVEAKPAYMDNWTSICHGPFGPLRSLLWNGRFLTQGEWKLRASRYSVENIGHVARLKILAEKLDQGASSR